MTKHCVLVCFWDFTNATGVYQTSLPIFWKTEDTYLKILAVFWRKSTSCLSESELMHCSITRRRGSMTSNTKGFSDCLVRNTSTRSSTCKHRVTDMRTNADRETWWIYPKQLLQTAVGCTAAGKGWGKLFLAENCTLSAIICPHIRVWETEN